MIDRFRPIWFLGALLFEIYYRTRRFLGISAQKEKEQIQKVNSEFLALEKNEDKYLRLLLGRYPDQAWAQKYVRAGMGLAVPGILAFHDLQSRGVHSIWTSEANVQDCKLLLARKVPTTTAIRLADGTPHSIVLTKYSPKRREFYF